MMDMSGCLGTWQHVVCTSLEVKGKKRYDDGDERPPRLWAT